MLPRCKVAAKKALERNPEPDAFQAGGSSSAQGEMEFKPDWDNKDEECSGSQSLDESDLDNDEEESCPNPLQVELDLEGDVWEESALPKFGFITVEGIGRQRVKEQDDGTVFANKLRRLGIGKLARFSQSKAGQELYVMNVMKQCTNDT